MAATFDNDLMPAFHENDREAVRVIFREHYASMVRYADQLISNQQEAEEIVVNTFIKLIAMRQNFKTAADVKAFLLVTVRNACYDYLSCIDLQKPSKREMLYLSDLTQTAKGSAPVPFDTEMIMALYDGINKLSPPIDEVFRLYFYNKMTTKDVAAQLGISVKTVRAHKAKATKLLRSLLSKKQVTTPSNN